MASHHSHPKKFEHFISIFVTLSGHWFRCKKKLSTSLSTFNQKEKLLTLNCTEPFMQYMEVPLTNASQILDGFFTATSDQPPAETPDTELKQDFDVEKVPIFLEF